MAEARDRLIRQPADPADAYARWLTRNRRVFSDPPAEINPDFARAPARPMTQTGLGFGATGVAGGGRGLPRSIVRTPRTANGRGRILFGSSAQGRENTPLVWSSRQRRGRGNSGLPSWFPRTPLQDITDVVRAMERRRDRLAENDGEHTEGQVPQVQGVPEQSLPVSGAQLEHGVPATPYSAVRTATPYSGVRTKHFPPPSLGKVRKILREAATLGAEEEFLTPQKKLLNSIDTVGKVVMEELQRLERTPSAKKAEWERKVRTLMSMR